MTTGGDPTATLTPEEERTHLKRLIAQYKKNIRQLEMMLAGYGLEKPLRLVNALEGVREQLAKAEADLTVLDGATGEEATPGPLFTFPRRPFFVGREEYLETILEAMSPDKRTYVVALDGIGGVGKTTLAIEAAYRCREAGLFEAVVWTTAKETELSARGITKRDASLRSLTDLYYAIARTFGDQTIDELTSERQQARAYELLKKQLTLLVIDNLETLEDVEPFAQFLRRTPLTTKTITTSRERLIDEARLVRVYGMSREEGLKLLEREAGEKGVKLNREQMEKVYERTGGIPLAIVWSVGQMSVRGQTVERVLQRLGRAGDNPLVEFCFHGVLDALGSLNTRYMLLAAALVPAPTTLEALQAIAGIKDDLDAGDALGRLLQLSLLNKRENRCYELLPLTRTFTEGELEKEARWREDAHRRWTEFWALRLPDETGYKPEQLQVVEAELRAIAQADLTGKAFEGRIRGLLELLGYRVQHDRLVAGRQTDLVAVKDLFPGRLLYLVECKDYSQPVGVDVISDVENRLKVARGRYPNAQGWVVARSGFTPEAQDYAESLRIVCSTPDDLVRSLIDFTPYLNDLIHSFQDFLVDWERGLKLPQIYVEPDAFYRHLQQVEPPPKPMRVLTKEGPLQTLVDEWLVDPELNQLTLLGDYGTGKTVFTLKLAHDLAQAYLAGQGTLIPVRISLKEFDPKQEVDDLVMNHLRRHGLKGSPYAAFQYLLRRGMLLLILDGFDEITAQVTPELTRRNFDKLDALVDERARVLLTCRTHYFRDRPEVEALLERQAGLPEMRTRQGTELYQAIIGRPNYRILYLREFDEPKIIEYLQKARGGEWERDWRTIRSIYNLEDLVQRPVLLDMVVKSLPKLRERKGEVTGAGLYDVYTGFWIHRDDWRAIMTPAGKAAFTEELAWRLWTANRERLHYAELTDLAQELLRGDYFKPGAVSATALSQADIEYAAHEVRTAAFLTRDAEGNYGFAHWSFMVFFAARRLARGLLDGSAPEVRINEEIRGFTTQLISGQMSEVETPQEIPESMVYVPPGPFVMGGQDGFPVQIARLEEGFFIGRYPVTNAEYRRFVEAGGYEKREYWSDEGWQRKRTEEWAEPRYWDNPKWNQSDQPVVGVSWYEAEAYARWAGMRLPTELEWEKAARGIDGRQYPWGDGFDPSRCNTDESSIGETTPVGQYSPGGDSPYGLADMAGNVWEWCADWYDEDRTFKVVRGGSWHSDLRDARCSSRYMDNPHDMAITKGFRISRGLS